MSENRSFHTPAAGLGINPDSLQEAKHASQYPLKRIFNEISSVGDSDHTGACCDRSRSPGSPASFEVPCKFSVDEPACKSRRCLSQKQLIPYGPSNPIITVKHDKAQLTIFYAGTVNVYDDVPVDKAHGIMRNLAGTGEASPIDRNHNIGDTMAAQQLLGSVRSPPFSAEAKHEQLVKRSHGEIPFARIPFSRKASLARFLEKRKERIQAKAIMDEEYISSKHADSSSSTTKRGPS